MKINLLLNNKSGVLNTFLNIDPFSTDSARLKADVNDLNHSVEDGEAEIILARNILEYFPLNQCASIINGWLKKLRKNGKLLIESPDYEKICMDVYYGKLEFIKFHELIYGKQNSNWDYKKSMLSLSSLTRFFEEFEIPINITQKRFDNYNFIIEVQK